MLSEKLQIMTIFYALATLLKLSYPMIPWGSLSSPSLDSDTPTSLPAVWIPSSSSLDSYSAQSHHYHHHYSMWMPFATLPRLQVVTLKQPSNTGTCSNSDIHPALGCFPEYMSSLLHSGSDTHAEPHHCMDVLMLLASFFVKTCRSYFVLSVIVLPYC